MMTALDVISAMEEWAPGTLQEEWDNSGLCIGRPDTPVSGVLICLDCTEAIIDEALEAGANMIISHHPLIFKGIKQLCDVTPTERTIAAALRNHMVIYSVHTNADKVMDGVSGAMAEALGLQNLSILAGEGETHRGVPCGMGLVGDTQQEVNTVHFFEWIKSVFSISHFKGSEPFIPSVRRVAVCGGSGGSRISRALESGAQVYISGDFSYHQYFDVEPHMMLIDIGHYESEVGVLTYFNNVLRKKFPTFAVRIAHKNTNPLRIY